MRWPICLALPLAMLAGCSSDSPMRRDTPADAKLFAPATMRLHPIFTGVKDWTSDGVPDGIEAELEFLDAFEDPTKASGRVIFELYDHQTKSPDPRGTRLGNPWVGSIGTVQEQRARWNRTSRTYSFQLTYPGISAGKTYVLTASFEPQGAPRLFSRTILRGRETIPERVSEDSNREPATVPAVTQPNERTPEP